MGTLGDAEHGVADARKLLAEARSGDAEAFMRLVEPHRRALSSLAYAITRSAAMMEDAVQETYIKAFGSIAKLRDDVTFRAWLFRIGTNAALDELRRQRRVTVFDPGDVETMVDSLGGGDDTAGMGIDVTRAVLRLSEAQRSALMLVDAFGFDYKTASSMLGVPMGTVATRVRAARSTLRSLLGAEYGEGGP